MSAKLIFKLAPSFLAALNVSSESGVFVPATPCTDWILQPTSFPCTVRWRHPSPAADSLCVSSCGSALAAASQSASLEMSTHSPSLPQLSARAAPPTPFSFVPFAFKSCPSFGHCLHPIVLMIEPCSAFWLSTWIKTTPLNPHPFRRKRNVWSASVSWPSAFTSFFIQRASPEVPVLSFVAMARPQCAPVRLLRSLL